MHVLGYKVKNSVTEMYERMSKCPRGYSHECSKCQHIKLSINEYYLACLDIKISDFSVHTYVHDHRQLAAVSYNESMIGEWILTNYVESNSKTDLSAFSMLIPLDAHVINAIRNLYTTGQIVLEFHQDIRN